MLADIPLSTLMLPPAYRDSVNREGTGSNRFRQGDSAALAAADRAPWRPARTASVLERQGKDWLVRVADHLFQQRPQVLLEAGNRRAVEQVLVVLEVARERLLAQLELERQVKA